MELYELIRNRKEKISIIGLGYVGIQIAVAFAKKANVIGFDISKEKVVKYLSGIDITNEVGDEEINKTEIFFTSEEKYLRDAKFHIVAVPTPINFDKTPNLKPIELASEIVGRNLTKGSIIVFESTVYPGVTEGICVPILEKESGLKCGTGFKVGYSPERINPGDKRHRLDTIIKIVSGMDAETVETVAKIYEMVVETGVYKTESIKVAEAAKVIENAQRDINIAFMNELSIIFNRLNIDIRAVLNAAKTKWNFLNFTPGLVGGHCIGVDPYYLTYKAEQIGYHSQIILSGRNINDGMGKYVAENVIKLLIKDNCQVKNASVLIVGITFKENIPDIRNSKVIDIINELSEYDINIEVCDPYADPDEVMKEYGISLVAKPTKTDAIILAVAHEEYKQKSVDDWSCLLKGDHHVIVDINGMLDKEEIEQKDLLYWSL